jgi:hypothetical protein
MQLSMTPKFHLLMNHILDQLVDLNGFADMTEDRIERYHQLRERLRDRTRRIVNVEKSANTLAKLQHIMLDPKVLKEQSELVKATERKRKAGGTLKDEQHAIKKSARDEDRRIAREEVVNEERVILVAPRKMAAEDFRNKKM